jgi:DNA-binding LytR/AlgR family response regulator
MSEPTAILAEDEAPQRETLCELLQEHWPKLRVVAVCEDGLAALEALDAHRPEVAFLDIRMPGANGLAVARAAAESGTLVVFTTAFDEYAVTAFEAGAVDYLLKPMLPARLAQALARIQARLAARDRPDLSAVLERLRARPADEERRLRWISASVGDTVKMFGIDEVLYFRAGDKYTQLVAATGDAVIRTPLKELLAQLDPEEFWQVHRSVIVRVSAIAEVRKDELGKLALGLKGRPETLPVSASFHHRFRGM